MLGYGNGNRQMLLPSVSIPIIDIYFHSPKKRKSKRREWTSLLRCSLSHHLLSIKRTASSVEKNKKNKKHLSSPAHQEQMEQLLIHWINNTADWSGLLAQWVQLLSELRAQTSFHPVRMNEQFHMKERVMNKRSWLCMYYHANGPI